MKTAANPVRREAPSPRRRGGAVFLLARDLRKTWPSYVAAALLGIVSGVIASVLLEGVFVMQGFGGQGESIERVSNSLLVDFWFLAIIPAFALNFSLNRDHAARFTQYNMSRRLSFLRSLPIPVRDLVTSRVLSALLSLMVSATPFFVVAYLLFDADGGRRPVEVYVPFAAIWVAYALVMGGFYLYVWLGLSERKVLCLALILPVLLLLVTVASNLTLGAGLVEGSLELSRSYGLLAIAILASGAAGFALWMVATSRRLKRKEF